MLTKHAESIKKLPSWLYKLGSQIYIDRMYPRHLFIETTAKCNLDCSYCPREKVDDHMDFRLFQSIVDEASIYGSRSFSLHLFGEPMLYPNFLEACQYIRHKNKQHTILLTTNGTMLNSRVDELIQANPNKAIWSWRPEVKFKEETLRKLKAWGKFTVRIIRELTPEEEVSKWKKWPSVEYRNIHNYGGDIDAGLWRKTKPKEVKRWPCYHLWMAPAVAWNGDILLCCVDPHRKEVLGNLKDTTVGQVWRGKSIESIRESHLKGEFKGICANCDSWKVYPDIFFEQQKGY